MMKLEANSRSSVLQQKRSTTGFGCLCCCFTGSLMRILNDLIYRTTKFLFFLTAQSCLRFLFTLSFFPPSKPFGSHRNFSFACLSTTNVARRKRASATSVFERFTRCRFLRELGKVVSNLNCLEDQEYLFISKNQFVSQKALQFALPLHQFALAFLPVCVTNIKAILVK